MKNMLDSFTEDKKHNINTVDTSVTENDPTAFYDPKYLLSFLELGSVLLLQLEVTCQKFNWKTQFSSTKTIDHKTPSTSQGVCYAKFEIRNKIVQVRFW